MTTLAELRKRAEAMHCPVRHGCGKGLHTHTMLKDKGYGCVLSDCPRAALLEAVAWVEGQFHSEEMVERLADYAHAAWSGWMIYLFRQSKGNPKGSVTIPPELVDRWKRQAATLYKDLPPAEKHSDRSEAKTILALLTDPAQEDEG